MAAAEEWDEGRFAGSVFEKQTSCSWSYGKETCYSSKIGAAVDDERRIGVVGEDQVMEAKMCGSDAKWGWAQRGCDRGYDGWGRVV